MAFNLEFLKVQRDFEYELVRALFPPGSRLLEIGAGSGYQARRFTDDGFDVAAIDMNTSNYVADRMFDVVDYDGRNIPYGTGEFDVVFSSSVLEHVIDLTCLHAEIKRVLKPDGIIVHVLPSGAWRFWTLISGYIIGAVETTKLLSDFVMEFIRSGATNWASRSERWRNLVKDYWLPTRHGEIGNVFSEIWYFSRLRWLRDLRSMGFVIKCHQSTGLFYTGNMFFGEKMSVYSRKWLSKLIGSACRIYVLVPSDSK